VKFGRTGRCLSFWLEQHGDTSLPRGHSVLPRKVSVLVHSPHTVMKGPRAGEVAVVYDEMRDWQGGNHDDAAYSRRGGITAP